MSWSFVAAGTASNGNNSAGPLTPGLPAGWAAGDLLVTQFQCFGGTSSRVPSMAASWPGSTWQNGTGSHGCWFKIAEPGEGTPSITLTGSGATGDTQLSKCFAFRSTLTTAIPTLRVQSATHTNASADNIGPITGLDPDAQSAGDLMLISCGKSNDWNGSATLTGWTNASQTESTTGSDAGMALMYLLSAATGDYGDLTVSDNGGTASTGLGYARQYAWYEVIPTMPPEIQSYFRRRQVPSTLHAL